MRPPFPGMDPWLEHPARWLGVHNRLITAIADEIVPKVAPRYFVDIEQHTYVSLLGGDPITDRPDIVIGRTKSRRPLPRSLESSASTAVGVLKLEIEVPVKDRIDEWYLEIRDVGTGKLVTVIEVLSPTNKSHVAGRKKYCKKRNRIFGSNTNLIEIDLLRAGKPMPIKAREPVESDYRIMISPSRSRPRAKLLAFGVHQPIPAIPIPLLPKDPEPSLDLNGVLHALYERARFDLRLDYAKPPVPPLSEDDAEWARAIVARRVARRLTRPSGVVIMIPADARLTADLRQCQRPLAGQAALRGDRDAGPGPGHRGGLGLPRRDELRIAPSDPRRGERLRVRRPAGRHRDRRRARADRRPARRPGPDDRRGDGDGRIGPRGPLCAHRAGGEAMMIEGDARRVTIYVGSQDTWHGRNLAAAIVERCRVAGPGRCRP